MNYIHGKGIVHRDIKPENIFLKNETNGTKVKIGDFWSSKKLTPNAKSTPYIVSRYYRAPELLLGNEKYSEKIDIFSAGCLIAELFTLVPLFRGEEEGL